MEQDLSGDTSGTYSGSDTSSTPEDYNDSTTSTDSSSDSGTYPGTNISTGSDGGIGSMYQTGNMFGNKAIYTSMRGATATNPFPESFFSKMFGAENVDYTNILGGSDRINEINDLRYNQAIGGMSNKTGANTGKQYQMGDYYIDQPTQMGTVKEVPQTGIGALLDNLPYIGTVSNMLGRNRGLPEDDPRYQEIMNEKAKSANDPTVFDRVSDYVKEVTGFGPKDKGNSLSIPVQGQEKQTEIGINPFAPQEKFAEFSGIQSMINKQNTNPISVPASVDIQQIVNNPFGRQDPYGYTMVNTPYTSTGTKLSPLLP